jgi:hypothetical protein
LLLFSIFDFHAIKCLYQLKIKKTWILLLPIYTLIIPLLYIFICIFIRLYLYFFYHMVTEASFNVSISIFFWLHCSLNSGPHTCYADTLPLRHSPAIFALLIFEIGSCFMPWPAWTVILIFVLPCSWKDSCAPWHEHFAWAGCTRKIVLPISATQVARITGKISFFLSLILFLMCTKFRVYTFFII